MSLMSILAGPLINTVGSQILEAYRAKLSTENSLDMKLVEVALREAELRSQERVQIVGKWTEPANIMGYICAFYLAKVVVWDTMLGLGSTNAIHGAVGEWMGMIMTFFVGRSGVIGAAVALRRR